MTWFSVISPHQSAAGLHSPRRLGATTACLRGLPVDLIMDFSYFPTLSQAHRGRSHRLVSLCRRRGGSSTHGGKRRFSQPPATSPVCHFFVKRRRKVMPLRYNFLLSSSYVSCRWSLPVDSSQGNASALQFSSFFQLRLLSPVGSSIQYAASLSSGLAR